MNKICAITGSNGYVGSCVKNYFAAQGWEILELTRQPKPGTRGIQFQLGMELSPQLLAGANVLVHCAYDFQPLRWDEIRAVNVEGARKLLQAARAAGIGKIICISSISAYQGCRSLYGQAKLEIERIAIEYDSLVIRPGLVYGSGAGLHHADVSTANIDALNSAAGSETEIRSATSEQVGGMFGKLAAQVRKSNYIPMIGDGSQIQFLVHNQDLCAFIERYAAGKIELLPRILTAANEQPWPFKKLLLTIAHALGRRPKFIPLPWRIVWAGLKAAELCGFRLNFRSDSLVSLMYQNPNPDFSANADIGLDCRPFQIENLKL